MSASAATPRIVVRSYPCAAKRSRAARRIAARVRSERLSGGEESVLSIMPTSVGLQVLTFQPRPEHDVNNRWPTLVGTLDLPHRSRKCTALLTPPRYPPGRTSPS